MLACTPITHIICGFVLRCTPLVPTHDRRTQKVCSPIPIGLNTGSVLSQPLGRLPLVGERTKDVLHSMGALGHSTPVHFLRILGDLHQGNTSPLTTCVSHNAEGRGHTGVEKGKGRWVAMWVQDRLDVVVLQQIFARTGCSETTLGVISVVMASRSGRYVIYGQGCFATLFLVDEQVSSSPWRGTAFSA